MLEKIILLVDDSVAIRSSAKFILNEFGYKVETAVDGLEGIKKLKELEANGDKVAMIISDVNMPNMDGITFIRILKSTEFKSIPILIMTTETQESIKMEGKKAGAVGWLTKPFKPNQLISVIKKFAK